MLVLKFHLFLFYFVLLIILVGFDGFILYLVIPVGVEFVILELSICVGHVLIEVLNHDLFVIVILLILVMMCLI